MLRRRPRVRVASIAKIALWLNTTGHFGFLGRRGSRPSTARSRSGRELATISRSSAHRLTYGHPGGANTVRSRNQDARSILIARRTHRRTHTRRAASKRTSPVENSLLWSAGGCALVVHDQGATGTPLKFTLAISTLLTPLSPGMRPEVSAHERRAGSLRRDAALRALGPDWHRPKE